MAGVWFRVRPWVVAAIAKAIWDKGVTPPGWGRGAAVLEMFCVFCFSREVGGGTIGFRVQGNLT